MITSLLAPLLATAKLTLRKAGIYAIIKHIHKKEILHQVAEVMWAKLIIDMLKDFDCYQ